MRQPFAFLMVFHKGSPLDTSDLTIPWIDEGGVKLLIEQPMSSSN